MPREIGNPNQPLSNYIPTRSSTPEMGPGWVNPKKVERRISASSFSQIPRFTSSKPLARQPRRSPRLGTDGPSLHFSRRDFPKPIKKKPHMDDTANYLLSPS